MQFFNELFFWALFFSAIGKEKCRAAGINKPIVLTLT